MVTLKNKVIQVKNLNVYYNSIQKKRQALKDINFEVEEDEFVSILGPSGCGKTTLFNTIAGIQKDTAHVDGEIKIMGCQNEEIRKLRKIGVVFQKPTLLEWRNVRKNIELPLEIMDIEKNFRTKKINELLRIVNLEEFADYRPSMLSGGMQQKISIARALAYDPEILMMDEPFGALDEINRRKMNDELVRIWQKTKKTILFITHSIEEAVYLSNKIIILTKEPGTIKDIIDIDLPYPRRKYLGDIQFFEYIKKIRHYLE